MGYLAKANAANATALGQNSNATATNSVAIGVGSIANVANSVSFGAAGAERTLVNVAAGVIANGSTDVMNGGQLFTANQRVAAAFGGGAALDANGQLTNPTYTVRGTNFTNVGAALSALDATVATTSNYYTSNSVGPAASATGSNALATGSSATASGTNAIATGTGAQATQSGAIAIGAGAVANATSSTAIGPGAVATHANAVAIGSGSTTSAANTVSVGTAGNERRITNVAAGIAPTDAVNMGQISGITGGLQNQINDNRWEARGGIALALAAGGLHFDTRPGKLSVAGAYGNFKGASGLAVGLGYAATERLRFNATVSGSPDQGSMGGVVAGSFTLN